MSKKEWFVIIERLLELKIIALGDFSILYLTKEATPILKSKKRLDIKSERLEINKKEKKVKQEENIEYDKELFEALREKRASIAEDMGVPAYIIFNDKTLKYLASEKPDDKESMLEINGIGEKKYNSFGEEFLKIIKIYKI